MYQSSYLITRSIESFLPAWPFIGLGQNTTMRFLITILLWFILLALCWPLAILLIFLFPVIWLISLPFRLLGIAVGGVFKLIEAIFMLPFRLLSAK